MEIRLLVRKDFNKRKNIVEYISLPCMQQILMSNITGVGIHYDSFVFENNGYAFTFYE